MGRRRCEGCFSKTGIRQQKLHGTLLLSFTSPVGLRLSYTQSVYAMGIDIRSKSKLFFSESQFTNTPLNVSIYTQLHKEINPFFIWHRTKKKQEPNQTNTMLCPNNSLSRHFQFAKSKRQHAKPRGQCSHNNKDFVLA